MEDLFEQFIKERRYFRNLAEKTLQFYQDAFSAFNRLNTFDNLSKQSLQAAVIALRERGTSVGCINAYLRGVNAFLNWLHQEHGYDNLSLKLLKGDKRIFRALSESELKAIVRFKPQNASEKRLQTILLLMMDTGLRVTECLTLERSKVDFDNLLLTVIGKGNKERVVPFSYELRKVLFKFLSRSRHELCFPTNYGGKLAYCNLLRDFYLLMEKLGIKPDGAFHAFRRTFATNYIRSGGNPLVLQRLLGHTTLQQTNVYIKMVTEDLQKEQHRTSLLNRIR